ncbi:DMT family transporter [Desulfonatronospira sp.]|uniref:DMT family transporter n=1 Tax=Desulfonatronospira sp. TaxID=1962951 RepID=UPI0025C6A6DB|nr:DMT family transporter [Desulfonatronospira sp.]
MSWKSHLRGDLLLLLTALIWGTAFVAQKVGMDHMGPFMYTGIRFALGALVLTPLIFYFGGLTPPVTAHRKGPSLLLAGLISGGILFVASILQQVGIIYTTAGKAGFITGLYVVIVPLLGCLWGFRPGPGSGVGALLAVTGLYLLTITDGLHINLGDSLVLGCAFMYALHVIVIGWLAPRMDVLRLAAMQFWVCALLSLLVGLVLEELTWSMIKGAAVPILYGGALSVGVAFTLQVVAQKRAPPTHAAVILSLETVFAVLAGVIILGEVLSPRGWTGCALMLAGMLAAQLDAVFTGGNRLLIRLRMFFRKGGG